ncbi:Ser-Thr-rich GPI-anchored membrane family protein [Streptomyces sp. NPDC046821]|uniref:Ser-Thr-rich GPI-anchored membrane family protein n=1 Tax=Streptomyces sp. NPDC046821 TaxID=3154702 RepID=UPI0033F8596F
MFRPRLVPATAAAFLCCLGTAPQAVPDTTDSPVSVITPSGDTVYPVDSSLYVGWRNSTGEEVDVWLTHGSGSDAQRLFKLASKASNKPSSELLSAVPAVPNGDDYAVEVAARDSGDHDYSAPFKVGPTPGAGPTAAAGHMSG